MIRCVIIDDEFFDSDFIQRNSVAIGFPYLRSFISNITLNCNIKPIILPTYNFSKKIIEEVKADFNAWLETRKFAPTIKALKHKLNDFKVAELDTQRKKINGFNEEQAEIISNNIIQKITNHFAHHLKDDDCSTIESLELIKKVFQLEESSNHV